MLNYHRINPYLWHEPIVQSFSKEYEEHEYGTLS